MMAIDSRYLSAGAAMLALCGSAVIAEVGLNSALVAQEAFSDVAPDYWATPFIQVLAQKDIVTGYPDGTFRPKQPIERDEFAAIIRKAFSQETERTISSASRFGDVPKGYWAEVPIEEAYETGFMNRTSENAFSPQQPLDKVEAIVALNRGLEATFEPPKTTASNQTRKRQAKNHLVFPLASTLLMGSFLQPQTPQATTVSDSSVAVNELDPENSFAADAIVKAYYEDAEQIPLDAIDDVALATKEGIIVNYPQTDLLEPNKPLERGAAAALVHQSLVTIGKLEPLAEDLEVTKYIVGPFSDDEIAAKVNTSK